MPPPQQQQQRRRAGVRTCASILCAVLLLFACVTVIVGGVAWLIASRLHQGPQVPRFTLAPFSMSGGQVAFNVSDSNPNRHVGIHYKGATRASLLYHDSLVASGPAIAAGWYQPSLNTTAITGVLDVLEPWTTAVLRTGRLPLCLRLTTVPIGFTRSLFFFPSVKKSIHVNCDLLVGADGRLLRGYAGEPCDSYFGLLDDDDD